MKTIITITFYHNKPTTIESIKLHITRIIKEWLNINEVSIIHENK